MHASSERRIELPAKEAGPRRLAGLAIHLTSVGPTAWGHKSLLDEGKPL